MTARGCLRVADLYARSERRPGSDCWWWLGAMAVDHVSPRIWTYDHDRADKYAMSGPKAVWNIAHGAGTNGRLAFMRCVNASCVSPHHVGTAWSKAEIGLHIARNGKRKGNSVEQRRANLLKAWAAAGVTATPPQIVLAIRAADPGTTNKALGTLFGICHTTVSMIRLGKSHRNVVEAA